MNQSAPAVPWLTRLSVERPGWVIAGTLVITLLVLTQFPLVQTDTDPKNMLPATSTVRVSNDEVERW
jgi:uncharacterized membrane protein YdfJ with MMPL/SSD domain